MSGELLRRANVGTIRQVLQQLKGAQLSKFDHFPKNCVLVEQQSHKSVVMEYSFHDFKQAFCHFNLIANTCRDLNYYPDIFNVYNKLRIELYSRNERSEKILTEKDLYISHLIDSMNSNTVDQAHGAVLEKISQIV